MMGQQDWVALAETKGIITHEQALLIKALVNEHERGAAHFAWHHVLYYLGGFVCIGAMSLFLTIGWQKIGAPAVLSLTATYMVAFYSAMRYLQKFNFNTPAALAATAVVCATPLMLYSLLWFAQVWPGEAYPEHPGSVAMHSRWNWLMLELSAIISALWLLRAHGYPLLVLPLSLAFYTFLMDILHIVHGMNRYTDLWSTHSIVAGAVLIILAVAVDIQVNHGRRYSFWFYMVGATVFWLPVTHLLSATIYQQAIYALLCFLMLVIGTLVRRNIFFVYGGLGLAWFLVELSHTFFRDSVWFPVSLVMVGALLVCCGIVWQKRRYQLNLLTQRYLPLRFLKHFL